MSYIKKERPHRLAGRQFEPPRKPDFLTRPVVVAFNDRRYGSQKGRADAGGFCMEDAEGVPHAERLIGAQADRAIADQQHGFRYAIENAQKTRDDAVEEQADAAREVGQADKRDGELKAQEEALGHRHGPSVIGYGLVLLLLFGVTLPIDYGAAMWTPLPPLGQWLLAILIGAAGVLCAHQAAVRAEALHEAHKARRDDWFGFRKEQVALAFALGTPVAVIVGTALWRAQALSSEQQATGGLVHGGLINVAFALLALLAFVVAVLAGMSYRRAAQWREIRAERARLRAGRQRWQQVLDQAERRQCQAEVTLAYLAEREEHVIESIRHWASERKARLRQRAAAVEMRERRKQASRGQA